MHVIDAAHPNVEERIESVNAVLAEIGVQTSDVVHVLNKTDAVAGSALIAKLTRELTDAVAVSAKTGAGLPALVELLARRTKAGRRLMTMGIPLTRADVIRRIKREGLVVSEDYEADNVRFTVWLPERLAAGLEEFAL
ncbi:MAG: hypothetical protein M5R36_22805 [Deltaproteobacteria bacterium]|nr:hypothetical protein [Deltaproteobacteria bacterium]